LLLSHFHHLPCGESASMSNETTEAGGKHTQTANLWQLLVIIFPFNSTKKLLLRGFWC